MGKILNTNKLLKRFSISIIPIVPFKSAKTQSLATTYFVDAPKGKAAKCRQTIRNCKVEHRQP
jgi:hypothetical protein